MVVQIRSKLKHRPAKIWYGYKSASANGNRRPAKNPSGPSVKSANNRVLVMEAGTGKARMRDKEEDQ